MLPWSPMTPSATDKFKMSERTYGPWAISLPYGRPKGWGLDPQHSMQTPHPDPRGRCGGSSFTLPQHTAAGTSAHTRRQSSSYGGQLQSMLRLIYPFQEWSVSTYHMPEPEPGSGEKCFSLKTLRAWWGRLMTKSGMGTNYELAQLELERKEAQRPLETTGSSTWARPGCHRERRLPGVGDSQDESSKCEEQGANLKMLHGQKTQHGRGCRCSLCWFWSWEQITDWIVHLVPLCSHRESAILIHMRRLPCF